MRSKRYLRYLTIPLMLLLICVAAFSFVLHSKTTAVKAAAATGLHVVGNHIENGSGQVIIPHGVDRMGSEYSCPYGNTFDGPVDQSSVNAMLSWDVNIVRLPLNEDCWLGINGYPGDGLSVSSYRQNYINFVNLLNQNGIVVIVDLHWTHNGGTQSTNQQPMPDLDHAPSFWSSVASTFKNNSSVMFDLFNEPYGVSWSCWKNGSSSAYGGACNSTDYAVAGMQTLVNTVRNTGASNILMLGGLAYSNDLTGWLANEPSDSDHNLVASTHIYNFNACASTSCWNSEIAPVSDQVPVLAGELGENDCASGFINGLMSWLDQHSIGYLAWTWTPDSCSGTPALITNYNGSATNYGQGYKNHLLTVSSVGGGGGGGGGFNPTSGTKYRIVNRNSGQVLDVTNQSKANGGLVEQWANNGGANQEWTFEATNGGYKIVNVNSGLVFDNPGGSTTEGTQLDQWSDTNGNNQWWNIVSAGSGYYHIVNQSSGYYVDVKSGSTTEGAEVIQWPSDGGNNQQWQFVAV